MVNQLILIIKAMRVKHYIKNILIFLPLVFSLNLLSGQLFLRCFLICVCFCLASSSVYLFNDIMDKEKDAHHPKKSKRPIASGQMSIKSAYFLSVGCAIPAVFLPLFLSFHCTVAVFSFLALNVAYTVYLKAVPLLDVACIAFGFILRVVAGSFATDIPISDWLLLTILSLSFFLGFGKRKAEIYITAENTRPVLQYYTREFLSHCMYSMMSVSIVFYSLWSIDSNTIAALHSDKLIYTVVPVILGLMRYAQVTEKSGEGDPTDILFQDRALHFVIASYLVAVIMIIYVRF